MRTLLALAIAAAVALSADARQNRKLSIRVEPISLDMRGDTARLVYAVTNAPSSTSDLFAFTVDAPTPAVRVERPARTPQWHVNTAREFGGRSVASWGFIEPTLAAGRTSPRLAFSAIGLPGIVKYWAMPYSAPDTVETADVAGSDSATGPGPTATDSGVTVGVVVFPPDRSPAALLSRLMSLVNDVCTRRWVNDAVTCYRLRTRITNTQRALAKRETEDARDELVEFMHQLDAQHQVEERNEVRDDVRLLREGSHVNQSAYVLLRGNASYVLARLRTR